jgi:ABC-2 type transport system ATP-binding protein
MRANELPAIQIKNLTKYYDKTHGINDITLDVKKGEIFGFLGPNGAGKSTTINTMLDILRPDRGEVFIHGIFHRDVKQTHRLIGYLATDMETDSSLTGKQYLSFVASQHGSVDKSYVKELVLRLKADVSIKIKHLSRGNRQKIGLIAALMHAPEVLILDEPTSGLDPLIQSEFYSILREHQQAGKTTFMSSHVLSEVQEICNRVGFIKDGELVQVSDLETLLGHASRQVAIRFKSKAPLQLKNLPGIGNLQHNDGLLRFTFGGDLNKLLALLASHPVTHLEIGEPNLEALFMSYYKKEENDV